MSENVLRTPVDDMVDLIKNSKICKIDYIAQKLKIPTTYIERWLVILEENKVIKLHFKGFEGYAIYNEQENNSSNELDIDHLKEVFLEKVRKKGFNSDQIQKAWKKFISEYYDEIKKLFMEKARKKGYDEYKIKKAWERYKLDLERL